MTPKQKAIAAIEALDDDANLDDAIDRLRFLRKIESALEKPQFGDGVARHLRSVERGSDDGSDG